MKKIAILTCDELLQYTPDEQILVNEFQLDGQFSLTPVSWSSATNWSLFDYALIRSTWDYTKRIAEFLKVLETISKKCQLINSLEVVKWNHHKKYLKELEAAGVKIVPTIIFHHQEKITIPWRVEKLILKPTISATSAHTSIIPKSEDYQHLLHPGDWMLQPFLENITEGEISLHYFGGKFSHACLKVPKFGDFRVQEEFGGQVHPYSPDEELLRVGDHIISQVPLKLLYARVDLVPMDGTYALMELELIEPSLHFRSSLVAASNFVAAFKDFVREE